MANIKIKLVKSTNKARESEKATITRGMIKKAVNYVAVEEN